MYLGRGQLVPRGRAVTVDGDLRSRRDGSVGARNRDCPRVLAHSREECSRIIDLLRQGCYATSGVLGRIGCGGYRKLTSEAIPTSILKALITGPTRDRNNDIGTRTARLGNGGFIFKVVQRTGGIWIQHKASGYRDS